MRLAALVAVALASVTAPALAQDARVRSGDHDTFARLVVYLPARADFEVERGQRTFAIDFGGDFGFEASDVFTRIPRTRVAELSGARGRLELDLGCDCVVTVERISDTIVYFDVNDPGTVPSPEPAELAADTGRAVPGTALAPSIRLPAIAAERTATLLPGGLGLAEATEAAEAHAPSSEPAPSLPADHLTSDTTQAVAEQIARAAAQGLLDVEPVGLPRKGPEPRASRPPVAEPDLPAQDHETKGTRRHVSMRSSVDEAIGRDVADALSNLGMTGPCLAEDAFDVADWVPASGSGLAAVRAHLLGEFDRADPEGVTNLARAYIGMTFGAEARQVIRNFRVGVPDADILLAMADIVDDGKARDPGRLSSQYDCPGAGALWAALSAPKIPDAAELDTDAVALAFSALPPHMRTSLGPVLAERLLDYGAVETASVVRTAVMRAPGTPTVETELLDASIAFETGREEEADAKLAEVVDETSGRSVEAVERLIERRLKAGEPVEDEVLAAADALIYEHRGTPLAYRLSELRIEGLAISGKTEHALAFLGEAEKHLPRETADRLRGVIYSEAAGQLNDAEFLLVAVKAPQQLGRSPEEMAARRAVARRLVEMELYAVADLLGVSEGRVAEPSPARAPAPAPALREPLPPESPTLERTAALLEHSAALRRRLSSALDGDGASAQTQ